MERGHASPVFLADFEEGHGVVAGLDIRLPYVVGYAATHEEAGRLQPPARQTPMQEVLYDAV